MADSVCECGAHFDAAPGIFYCSDRCREVSHRKMRTPYPGVPMSVPVADMRARPAPSGLSPSQLRARAEVLADRGAPRETTSLAAATLELIKLSARDATRRQFADDDARMIARLALSGSQPGELERRSDDRRDHSLDFVRR
jgi:hypothetical protein